MNLTGKRYQRKDNNGNPVSEAFFTPLTQYNEITGINLEGKLLLLDDDGDPMHAMKEDFTEVVGSVGFSKEDLIGIRMSISALEPPTTQIQEVLFMLLTNYALNTARRQKDRLGVSRSRFLNTIGCLNAPTVVFKLRRRGLMIPCLDYNTKNKFGRKVSFGRYHIAEPIKAIEIYKSLKD